jgi:hypothetical protein
MSTVIRPFRVEDMKVLAPELVDWGKFYESSGPAVTQLVDDKIVACGGLVVHGLGQVWLKVAEEARKPFLLRTTARQLDEMINERHLVEVYGQAKPGVEGAPHFFEHLGFRQATVFVKRIERGVG